MDLFCHVAGMDCRRGRQAFNYSRGELKKIVLNSANVATSGNAVA
ncbi:hypothetical protein CpCAPGE03_1166 [Corynebacterium pseudotuberculosis]|nr:Hypothetical protein Cp226_1568 [Corynebacterium pseudotuberculosis]ATB62454.1 Hypothetical protein BFF96_1579 [Corynebacterium pseudotuberculosis]AZN22083.1 Hypothetical protein CpOviAF1_1155 [Corynebacterium pseudotuberculosis]QBB91120.1 hypothetical protein CpCR07_1161 [Corynebacterium pseudotuberculosis]QBB95334.1 hypothetical protein CpCAPMI03_01161 [Corynebacterium pseudotuberculosis]